MKQYEKLFQVYVRNDFKYEFVIKTQTAAPVPLITEW